MLSQEFKSKGEIVIMNKTFTFNLDDDFDDLFYELERAQDGGHGHKVEIIADTAEKAADELLKRILPFFISRMTENTRSI